MRREAPAGQSNECRYPQRAVELEHALDRTELPDLHLRSFPQPFGRIESLCSLRFRVLLGDGAHELEMFR